jgi:hypothetical protein
MNNITTIEGGFMLHDRTYLFQPWDNNGILIDEKIMSDTQVLVGTDNGVLLLDLSQTINNMAYVNIDEFVNNLYQK